MRPQVPWGLMINLARILKSVFSDSGQLFMDIQACEKDMQTDADMAEKEGMEILRYLCDFVIYLIARTTDTLYQLPHQRAMV